MCLDAHTYVYIYIYIYNKIYNNNTTSGCIYLFINYFFIRYSQIYLERLTIKYEVWMVFLLLKTVFPICMHFNECLSPSAGDGVLLRVLWNGHVFGMHRRRAQRTRDCSSAGCSGAAQSCTEEPAGCYSQQVHAAKNNTKLTVYLSQLILTHSLYTAYTIL